MKNLTEKFFLVFFVWQPIAKDFIGRESHLFLARKYAMSLVLGVREIPKSEIELLRSILRLSSTLFSNWTLSEQYCGNLLLVEGDAFMFGSEIKSIHAQVVPVVARKDVSVHVGRVLYRPIYAEELVELLNSVDPGKLSLVSSVPPHPEDGARLKRWPAKAGLLRSQEHIRIATALTRSFQTPLSLSLLTSIELSECARFVELLDREGLIEWKYEASIQPPLSLSRDSLCAPALPFRQSLVSRIRRRLGLK